MTLTRQFNSYQHGESEFNVKNIIGGDSGLTENGEKYAKVLAHFFADMKIPNLQVWTSQLKRAIDTAKYFNCPQERWNILNEINFVSDKILFCHCACYFSITRVRGQGEKKV